MSQKASAASRAPRLMSIPRTREVWASGKGVPVPFRDAQQAWFWTMAALVARREASPRNVDGAGVARPAMPEDILHCLDALYREGRITLLHARVLRLWGERGIPPSRHRVDQHREAALWRDALDRLEWKLRVCGIVQNTSAD